MNISELQRKDIINVETGHNLGRIVDIEISSDGRVLRFATEPKKVFTRMFRNSETTIEFSSIVKIGTDVILVK